MFFNLTVSPYSVTVYGAQSGERITNMIVRVELEENGDNTGEFEGELEYVMLNQLNIIDPGTYEGIGFSADDPIPS